jgi:hypothetical protein
MPEKLADLFYLAVKALGREVLITTPWIAAEWLPAHHRDRINGGIAICCWPGRCTGGARRARSRRCTEGKCTSALRSFIRRARELS